MIDHLDIDGAIDDVVIDSLSRHRGIGGFIEQFPVWQWRDHRSMTLMAR
jgi:hypothetical protein